MSGGSRAESEDARKRDRLLRSVAVRNGRRVGRTIAPLALGLLPGVASASFLPPEVMDTAAMYLAWFIVVFLPIGGIVLFWLVHILPEKIAHRRHHPQRDAIQVLCLLSLVFGGMLWPIAWLWAYVKPVGHQLAYGTEKHEDYFVEMRQKWRAGELSDHEIDALCGELDLMAAKSPLPGHLLALRRELAEAQSALNAALSGGTA